MQRYGEEQRKIAISASGFRGSEDVDLQGIFGRFDIILTRIPRIEFAVSWTEKKQARRQRA